MRVLMIVGTAALPADLFHCVT